jgi:hypothetical protein
MSVQQGPVGSRPLACDVIESPQMMRSSCAIHMQSECHAFVTFEACNAASITLLHEDHISALPRRPHCKVRMLLAGEVAQKGLA